MDHASCSRPTVVAECLCRPGRLKACGCRLGSGQEWKAIQPHTACCYRIDLKIVYEQFSFVATKKLKVICLCFFTFDLNSL